jgi:hypothetical protein
LALAKLTKLWGRGISVPEEKRDKEDVDASKVER